MWDAIIVGAIVLAAAGYALYRLFMRPSCGCGCDCCSSRPSRPEISHNDNCSCSGNIGCSCGH